MLLLENGTVVSEEVARPLVSVVGVDDGTADGVLIGIGQVAGSLVRVGVIVMTTARTTRSAAAGAAVSGGTSARRAGAISATAVAAALGESAVPGKAARAVVGRGAGEGVLIVEVVLDRVDTARPVGHGVDVVVVVAGLLDALPAIDRLGRGASGQADDHRGRQAGRCLHLHWKSPPEMSARIVQADGWFHRD